MVAWKNKISLLMLKNSLLCSLVKYFSTLEEKFRIPTRPCNILYLLNFRFTELTYLKKGKINIEQYRATVKFSLCVCSSY